MFHDPIFWETILSLLGYAVLPILIFVLVVLLVVEVIQVRARRKNKREATQTSATPPTPPEPAPTPEPVCNFPPEAAAFMIDFAAVHGQKLTRKEEAAAEKLRKSTLNVRRVNNMAEGKIRLEELRIKSLEANDSIALLETERKKSEAQLQLEKARTDLVKQEAQKRRAERMTSLVEEVSVLQQRIAVARFR